MCCCILSASAPLSECINTSMNKDHKTRVAVLLRGQPRLATLGGLLYRRTIQDRFWDVDFRVAAASWDTCTTTMSQASTDRILQREFSQTRVSEPLGESLKNWGPGHVRKCRTSELMRLCHQLFVSVQRYTDISSHWTQGTSSYGIPFPLGGGGLGTVFANNIMNDVVQRADKPSSSGGTREFVDSVKLELLQLHYILGQIYCMGEAYNSYQVWKSDHPDWNPDVIWCTRPDAYSWFPDNAWHKMKTVLKRKGGIHTSTVRIVDGRPYTSDYNFFATPAELEHFGNISDNLLDAWANRPELLLNLIGCGSNLQHQLWSIVFRNTSIHNLAPSLAPTIENVLRPVDGLEDAVTDVAVGPTQTNMRLLNEYISQRYVYPVPNVPADSKLISDTWNDVMSD